MRVVSLFSGAGGFDLGLTAAGLSPSIAIDSDPVCRSVLRANFETVVPEGGDVANWSAVTIRDEAGFGRGEVDLMVGGPPCQPFSAAGLWHSGDTPRLRDSRASTLHEMLRLTGELLPRAVLIENVPGFAFKGKSEGLDLVRRTFAQINRRHDVSYRPVHSILDSADFGVPQHRRRLFIVALRDGGKFEFPEATHGDGRRDYVGCWDAIGGIKVPKAELPDLRVRGKWASLLPTIPEGENYLWHTSRGGGSPLFGWRTRYWNFLLKLKKDRPSWTLSASPGSATGPFHWDNRRLSRTELMAIQTFSKDFRLDCDYSSAQRLIGNSVAPLLAEVLGRSLMKSLAPETTYGSRVLKLGVLKSRAAPTRSVFETTIPSCYRDLGPKEDHPGTGAGPGAKKRGSSSAAKRDLA